ncbi:MAG: septal ring lytic transglycosylase RlpA family protein, partial [Proteobacteria bacterium]|nr:septal ring lytic transglycosylase RlpA family protein [Pseudomonadota bacterium]
MTNRRATGLGVVVACAALIALSGCAEGTLALNTAKRLTPSDSGRGVYKVGNPYDINGVTYYPAEDWNYDETGIASWYGPGFHEKYTANGEVYDQNDLTAAHKTLPMPSFVRVTNLDNGRAIVLRVNDRGPYARGRIIDVSRRGAQLLGFDTVGTAKVRVQ